MEYGGRFRRRPPLIEGHQHDSRDVVGSDVARDAAIAGWFAHVETFY